MAGSSADNDVPQRMQRIEALIQEIDNFPNPEICAHMRELAKAILDLHGAGLEKILEHAAAAGEPGRDIIDALGKDDLVANLLLLYGLHPLDVRSRVRLALDSSRSRFRTLGCRVEFLGIEEGALRLQVRRLEEDADMQSLKQVIEEAVFEKAPDLSVIEMEVTMAGNQPTKAQPRLALPLVHS
jgi:hypothetical protein